MVNVRVLEDGFQIGLTKYKKGTVFSTSAPAANYMVANGTGEIVVKKKRATKKKSYSRRDLRAED